MNPAPPVTTYVAIDPPKKLRRQTISRVLYLSGYCKRGGDHSSRSWLSPGLKQPTRKPLAGQSMALGAAFPYLALLHVGSAKPARLRPAGAVVPHLFALACAVIHPRTGSCGTLRPLG